MSKELSSLETALMGIEKKFGKGSVMKINGGAIPDIESISTGSLSLDIALGIGGYPKGRIIEIYGPESAGKTTLTLHAIAESQKQGGIAAFIDAEHALDISYAKRLGVNIDELLVSQPSCGEEALEIVEELVKSNALDIIVVDSVAALVPRAEIEGDMGDSHMGLQARLMGQAMRKLTGLVQKSNTTIIFINQIRMKIGVMFGCFHYDTLVNFTDGRSIPIGKVVDEKITGEVYCLNEKTNQIEIKPIIDWHDNGKVLVNTDFIHIQTNSINGGGRFGFTCTKDHEIYTDTGIKKAKELSINDMLISKYLETDNGLYGDFLSGILIGDSHISINDKGTACLKLQDNKNIEYIKWKVEKLKPILNLKEYNITRGKQYVSSYNYELNKLKKEIGNRDPMYMLNQYTNIGLAIWIMDDGYYDKNNSHNRYSISIKRFKNNKEKLDTISNKLASLGLSCTIRYTDGSIKFNNEVSNEIARRICKYVPNCMQYKLPLEYQNKYEEFNLENNPIHKTEFVNITDIRFASKRQMRNKRKFDITIRDNHNYMVGGINNGVIVHNSPETTTGGNALKFYASVRLDIRRIEGIMQGEVAMGNRVRVKVIKNKVASPFAKVEFDIYFDDGISKENCILDEGVTINIVKKSGTWFSYGDIRLGQGKANAKQFFRDNPEIMLDIENKIKDHYFSKKPIPQVVGEDAI